MLVYGSSPIQTTKENKDMSRYSKVNQEVVIDQIVKWSMYEEEMLMEEELGGLGFMDESFIRFQYDLIKSLEAGLVFNRRKGKQYVLYA